MLTLFGLSLGALIGGSVIVETVLGWPGIGALTVSAVLSRDVPLVWASSHLKRRRVAGQRYR